MKYNIDELKKMYKSNEEYIKQIDNDINEIKNTLDYYNNKSKEITAIQNDILKKISKIESESESESNNKETISNCQGVVIDYKLFSEILGVLTTAKQCNLCTQEFFDSVVQAGKNSESKKEEYNGITLEPVNKEAKEADENTQEELDNKLIENIIKQAILKSIFSAKTKLM